MPAREAADPHQRERIPVKPKFLAVAAAATAFAAFASTAQAKPQTFKVCQHGCKYRTIQSAVKASGKNDTIKVKPGTYKEAVVVHGHKHDGLSIIGTGMLAAQVVLHEDGVVRVPAHLSDEEAATLPCAAVTAWHALVTEGGLKAGDTALTQGTGGVSLFALQFGRLLGARVVITSSSDAKVKRALDMGASDGINYKTNPDWDKKARELTGDVGVDHVVELGGAGTLGRSLKAVRMGGRISLIGVLTGGGEVNPMAALMKNVRIQGIYVGSRDMFEAMNRAIALHRLRPVIERVFPFDKARAAFRHMESAAHFGKIALRV